MTKRYPYIYILLLRTAFIAAGLLLGLATGLRAQQADTLIRVGDPARPVVGKNITVAGKVVEQGSLAPIPGLAIHIEGSRDTLRSNKLGLFLLELPQGTYTLSVLRRASSKVTVKLELYSTGSIEIAVPLEVLQLEAVEIAARANDANIKQVAPGITEVRAIEFRAIPALMGEMDVIRSVLLLPGVSNTGEGAGGFNV
ncbi:MAG: hypothetical protein EAZ89_21090, partial [Bacteroidetes bacterium]